MQTDLFTYNSTMRQKRINLVISVLREVPLARKDAKTLLVEVWKRELNKACFCPMHIKFMCSSPEGILRDRRREEVLAEFPRDEKKFDHFVEYKDEFSKPNFKLDELD